MQKRRKAGTDPFTGVPVERLRQPWGPWVHPGRLQDLTSNMGLAPPCGFLIARMSKAK